MSRKKKQL